MRAIPMLFFQNFYLFLNPFEMYLLQLDNAPGHINGTIRRIIHESGRQILWTPPGTSGYVQPCDDIVNASFQNGFLRVSSNL